MLNFRRRALLFLCAFAILLSLAACKNSKKDPANNTSNNITEETPSDDSYSVLIVDGNGAPVKNVIVKVKQNGEQIKMYPYKGELLSLPLDPGTYELELDLSQLGEGYTFDESLCVLTPEKPQTTIRLFKTILKQESIFVGDPILSDYDAYHIGEGATKLSLIVNDYNFFVFTPAVSAIYTLTYECESDLSMSYHGGIFFVQGNDLSQTSSDIAKYENGLSLKVYPSNLGSSYVFAVKSTAATSCTIKIKNSGDTESRIEDAPWTPYLENQTKVNEQLAMNPAGTYTTIDLTDLSVKAVYNETDGYYHLGSATGPLIFIDLTSNCPYINSIQTICGNQGMNTYIYDETTGSVIEKRSYNELFMQYGMPSDASTSVEEPIRVALTEKLAEAIKVFGEKQGWWKSNSDSNIFNKVLLGAPYNQEYAWLLFCGYYA